MKKKDYILISSLIIGILILAVVWKCAFSSAGREVYVTVSNEEICLCNINEDCILQIIDGSVICLKDENEFDGRGNLLIISGGKADVISADCPDGVCVDMPPISKCGESIVCMPNAVIVSVR